MERDLRKKTGLATRHFNPRYHYLYTSLGHHAIFDAVGAIGVVPGGVIGIILLFNEVPEPIIMLVSGCLCA